MPATSRGGRGVRRAFAAGLPSLVLVAAGLVAWQWFVAATGVRPQVLPSPLRVAEQGWAAREQIWANTVPTLQVTAVGFAVSLALGWMIAIAVDFSPWLRRALTPLLVVSQTLPIIAIAPLLIIWFGFGLLPKVVVIALVTFFPVAIGLIEGFASTPRAATNLLRSMGASRWQRFRLVRLPQAMPSFFTALRIGITYAVTGAIFAEYVGATAGLGIYMSLQKNSFRTDLVLAAVVVTAVLSVTLFALTFVVQRLVIPGIGRSTGVADLQVDGLRKAYGELPVLDGVSFTVGRGEFVAVIGPSGCGKSTLFDVVAGLEPPDGGRVLVDGTDVTGRTDAFAYMPQQDLLFPWRTVLDNTTLGLEVAGVRRRAARERARPLFAEFGLAGFEGARPGELSGGMRQRAALLRTVVQERPVLLLDEPFGALDALTRADMQLWLSTVRARFDWTVVLVTHDIREALFLADRVVVLDPRPTTVRREVAVDLPRPRDLSTITHPTFAAAEAELLGSLVR